MSVKLTFVPESTAILPGYRLPWVGLEAEDATGILDAWDKDPSWPYYGPEEFRVQLVASSRATIELPNEDDAILHSVVEALGPHVVTLEDSTTPNKPVDQLTDDRLDSLADQKPAHGDPPPTKGQGPQVFKTGDIVTLRDEREFWGGEIQTMTLTPKVFPDTNGADSS